MLIIHNHENEIIIENTNNIHQTIQIKSYSEERSQQTLKAIITQFLEYQNK
jgi:hypothetical protein